MGQGQAQGFRPPFTRFLSVDIRGSRVTSDGGLIQVRELDQRLGLGERIEQNPADSRAHNVRLLFAYLLRQSVYSRLAGYEDGSKGMYTLNRAEAPKLIPVTQE